MYYSRWATDEEIKQRLQKVTEEDKKDFSKSGIPLSFDENSLYLDTQETHNLVIGATGSGKTQSTVLPMIKLSCLAGEALIVNDPKGELYQSTANLFIENGYKTYLLDLDSLKYGEGWNPLIVPYHLYKKDNKDKAIKMVEDIAYYLLYENVNITADPFWFNSTVDFFTGMILYLFENFEEKDINFNKLNELIEGVNTDGSKLLNNLEINSPIYKNLVGTLKAPSETKGSILSVFNQKFKKYMTRTSLVDILSRNEIKLDELIDTNYVIYIMSGKQLVSSNIVPLFVNQVLDITERREKRLNIILDEFDELVPINGFNRELDFCRGNNIRFTVVIKSFKNLLNTYGENNTRLIELCFGNIIYLYSNDIYTLEEISRLCGMNNNNKPLISVEELKVIPQFNAIVNMVRMYPIKTKLIPDYQINWNLEFKKKDFE